MDKPTVPDYDLDRLYLLPRDTRWIEDFHRRRHWDLPALTDLDLDREAIRVTARLAFDRDPAAIAWLDDRRVKVRAEQRRRAPGNGPRPTPPPIARAVAAGAALTVPSGAVLTLVRGGGRRRDR